MTSVSLWKRMNGTARLEPASDRGNGGLLGQGEHLWGGQHRHLPAAEGRGGVGLDHGVAEGRLQARRQRHGTTLRRTATAGQAEQPQPHRGWLCNRARVYEQRRHDLLIGHDHDLLIRHIRGMCSYCKGVR